MKKNVIPAGLFYPGLKRLLQTMPLMAGMLLGGTTLAVANESNPVVQEQQQAISVTGTVVDQNGEPLMGVNVIEKGTTNGTMTDMDGRFTLSVPGNATLQISYIGYTTEEIVVNNQTKLNVTLKEDSQNLDELVVVGYGVVRKADLAGSVAVLDSKSFKDQPIVQVSDALQGRVSGVQVQNSGVRVERLRSVCVVQAQSTAVTIRCM